MRINDVKLAFPIVDRDIEQCAIIKIIAVVEVREIVRKLTGPKTWMCHRCDEVAIRPKKPGDPSPRPSETPRSRAPADTRSEGRHDPLCELPHHTLRATPWVGAPIAVATRER